ncbi:hypothetical protein SASPL_100844 [Salvia splendens]|uniref:Uncharacterized protein n=1 Tax=Salvia splendens TaxID=180675 RepID=A0A8X8YUQ1_SALSN|nr:hypothetical protein SASPL_100844 [Salvia splendens]
MTKLSHNSTRPTIQCHGVSPVVKLKCKRTVGDQFVGEVQIPVKDLFVMGLKSQCFELLKPCVHLHTEALIPKVRWQTITPKRRRVDFPKSPQCPKHRPHESLRPRETPKPPEKATWTTSRGRIRGVSDYTVSEATVSLVVRVRLMCKRMLGDRLVGKVKIPVKSLFDMGRMSRKILSYEVAGTPEGRLNLLYSFSETMLPLVREHLV